MILHKACISFASDIIDVFALASLDANANMYRNFAFA